MINKKYYVYVYYDSVWSPLYVGLGKNRRGYNHLSQQLINNNTHPFYIKIKDIFKNEDCVNFKIIKDNISLDEASIIEESIVNLLGRRNNATGILYNQKDGGIYAPSDTCKQRVALYSFDNCILIKKFESISDCSKFINGKKGSVRDALVLKYATKTNLGEFLITDYNYNLKEVTMLKEDILFRRRNRSCQIKESIRKPLIFFNINTKETCIYDNTRSARKELKCCSKTLKKYISSGKIFRKVWEVSYVNK